ncbi:histidine phosphatase family protein [Listeria aquatica]|uniref:Phosphoglycerate mutase n=3 Tax=Listeria aquatica TaxID=1494960 RepID=W7B9V0_9LIST|nr:histidine phosphatase family protein [Listeria aquatica]EUJ21475.1 phosphoglycerate mutase [Listeria aquatica FSL S10-1188]MBC1521963.1 histidine phosphatase family protein [Listeria aquatica]
MTGKLYLHLTRHGETMFNKMERIQGWSDTPLTVPGKEVAKSLGRGLDLKFDAVYTSDLRRTVETVRLVLQESKQTHLKETMLKDLRELCFGEFEGLPSADMFETVLTHLGYESGEAGMAQTSFAEIVSGVCELDTTNTAEPWEVMETRVKRALETIIQREASEAEKHILVVAHGLTINTAISLIAPEKVDPLLENASITTLLYEADSLTVQTVGDTSYILAGQK